eukprot:11185435-Lingulodinium_polyedra.AAC.1
MARWMIAMASAPPDTLPPPHCRAWNCLRCAAACSMLLFCFATTLRTHSPTCMGRARGFSRTACSSPVVAVGVARAAG